VRFGAASVASGAAALSLGEEPGPTQSALDTIAAAALTAELVTDAVQSVQYYRKGVAGALAGGWGLAEKVGATGLGAAVPLALHVLGAVSGNRGLSRVASMAVLGGSLLLRVSTMAAGD
jgi:protein NrfD